ncbi:MAG: right-handed parallel beta-helix repeat-containing protein [Fibrobacteria bacterium]
MSEQARVKRVSLRGMGLLLAMLSLGAPAWATTYYLDAASGDDGRAGTSEALAWKTLAKVNAAVCQPGDSILLKSGGSWAGQLSPKGSGADGRPIVVGRYGSGSKPRIAANGTAPSAVYLLNQAYWEIRDLEVTNTGASPADRRGIWIAGRDFGVIRQIHILNCDVHDVNGDVKWVGGDVADNLANVTFETGWDASKRSGGIVFETLQPGANPVKTRFEDILVEGCSIRDCSFGGIITKQWDGAVHWGIRNSASDTVWLPHTKVVFRNNFLSQLNTALGCNTIYLTDVRNGLIEGNACAGAGTSAIEVNMADSVVVQNNETYGTVRKANGADFNGIDPDRGTTRITIQYNYMHDNGDGLLLCQFPFGDCVVRYNILQNNSRYQMYLHSDTKGVASVYDNNAYFGSSVTVPAGDARAVRADPKFADPGRGANGNANGPALASLVGYRLQTGSPCINKGLRIDGNGGRDFWSGALYSGNPDVGAHEFGATVGLEGPVIREISARRTKPGQGKKGRGHFRANGSLISGKRNGVIIDAATISIP